MAEQGVNVSFANYAKRVFVQFLDNAKREVAPNVIALLAMLLVLVVQYRAGWIKTGEGWSTIIINILPPLGVFVLYLGYHLMRAPYEIDCHQQNAIHALSNQVADILDRPKVAGFFQDVVGYGYSDPLTLEEKQEQQKSVLARPIKPSVGTEIVICVRLLNASPTPTTLHNFSLIATRNDEIFTASHAEEFILGGNHIPASMFSRAEQTKVNLVSYLNSDQQLTQGKGIDGVLVFHLRGLIPTLSDESNITLDLEVQDAWGKGHHITGWGGKPRPSLRLRG